MERKCVQTAKCIVEGEVWGLDYKMQTIICTVTKEPKYTSLDGEATEQDCVNTVVVC